MTKIYVNLLGEWVELKDSDTIFNENPFKWLNANDISDHDYIWVGHGGKGYKIHKTFIQLVHEG